MAERPGTYEDYPAIDRYMSEKMPAVNDLLLKMMGQSKFVPNRDIDTPIQPTPATTAPKGTATRIPEQDPGELYHTVKDKANNSVTIFSSNGELRSDADFGIALKNHNVGKETPGFVVKPEGSYSEGARKGLYQVAREALPNAGQAVGEAIPSKMLELAVKAGLITPQTQASAVQTGGNVGRAGMDFVGQQVDTPGDIGMAVGTGLASKVVKPIVGASNEFLKTNFAKNVIGTGLAGVTGSTIGKELTGESQTAGKATEEFATAAAANGLLGATSYWVTRWLKPDTATKVATEMMDAIKKKYPTLINDENAFNIANATPKDISNLTSMMSKGLRGDAADEAEMLLTSLKSALPAAPTVAQQNTLRMHNRRIIEAQTKALDNLGDTTAFNEATALINQRKEEFMQAVRDMFPGKKNFVATEAVLAKHRDYDETFREGATVLHHLKQSGAGDKFDPMALAQRIRGEYTENPGSLLKQVGDILTQGGSLKDLPLPQPPRPTPTGFEKFGLDLISTIGKTPGLEQIGKLIRTNSTPTPWGVTPLTTANRTRSFAGQEAGQAAMRSFLKREEKE